jgi:molybdenum ABC transporter ATP-binding protein
MDALSLHIDIPLREFSVDLSLEVGAESVALVGPSGAGKTTVLRAIAGLARPSAGAISVNGATWFDAERGIDVPPEQRRVGLVFQDYALFPHLSVRKNVEFGGGVTSALAMLDRFGISRLANEKPRDLSGGERQRVALARALARDPAVLLLDEPLAALDVQTRTHTRGELREILGDVGLPTVLVTHDYADAAALAERVAVMVDGRIVQAGTATELVAEPVSPFVADFVGGNVLTGRARRLPGDLTEVQLDDGIRLISTDRAVGDVAVVVYPWEIAIGLTGSADSARNHVHGEVASVVPIGNRVRVRVGPLAAEVTAASAARLDLRPGRRVVASFKATGTRLLRA